MNAWKLRALVQRRDGGTAKATLFVSSQGVLTVAQPIAKSLAGNEVKIAAEVDEKTICVFRAKISADGTVKRTPGSSAEIRKADLAQGPTVAVTPPNKVTPTPFPWTPCLNEGGFVGSDGLVNSSAALPRTGDDGSQNWNPASAFEVDLTAGKSDAHPVIQKACEMIIARSRGGQ